MSSSGRRLIKTEMNSRTLNIFYRGSANTFICLSTIELSSSSFFLFLFFFPSSLVLRPGRETGKSIFKTRLRFTLPFLLLPFHRPLLLKSLRKKNLEMTVSKAKEETGRVGKFCFTSPTLPEFSLLGDSELSKSN